MGVHQAGAGSPSQDAGDLDRQLARFPPNDDGNGQRLLKRYGEWLLFVFGMNWACFDGRVWDLHSGIMGARRLAKRTAQAIHEEAETLRDADQIEDTIANMIEMGFAADEMSARGKIEGRREKLHVFARTSGNVKGIADMLRSAEDGAVVQASHFDAITDVFACENGTVDLFPRQADGEAGAPDFKPRFRPQDRMTALIPCAYDAAATCPEFDRFLEVSQPERELPGILNWMIAGAVDFDPNSVPDSMRAALNSERGGAKAGFEIAGEEEEAPF